MVSGFGSVGVMFSTISGGCLPIKLFFDQTEVGFEIIVVHIQWCFDAPFMAICHKEWCRFDEHNDGVNITCIGCRVLAEDQNSLIHIELDKIGINRDGGCQGVFIFRDSLLAGYHR